MDTAENTLVVVARFLALLELFKAGLCDFDQPEPLGRLLIHPTEMSEDGADLRTERPRSADEDESAAAPAATGADASATDDDSTTDRAEEDEHECSTTRSSPASRPCA